MEQNESREASGSGMVAEETILSVLNEYTDYTDLFIAPDIPAKKLKNARKKCKVPSRAKALGLIDNTIFGSARKGMIITCQGVYFYNGLLTKQSGQHSIAWLDFGDKEVKADGDDVDFGNGHRFNVMTSDVTSRIAAEIMNAIRAEVSEAGKKEQ